MGSFKKVAVYTTVEAETSIGTMDETSHGKETTRVIVVTSGKGGVGKTTTSANIGTSIARLGFKTVVIDSDLGLRNLDLLLGLENRIIYTAMEVFEEDCTIDQALVRDKRFPNLSLLAMSKNRQRFSITQANMRTLVKLLAIRGFQYILIDCPAGIDLGFIMAVSAADEAIVVTTPEITAIRDADRVASLLATNGIRRTRLLVNRCRADLVRTNDMMSVIDVQEMLSLPLLGVVPEDIEVITSTNRGEPLVARNQFSVGGVGFENAARRLVGYGPDMPVVMLSAKTPWYQAFINLLRNWRNRSL
jgi:septum site-determining protein MinD